MATKMKVMKLLQETSGLAEVTNRRPPSRTPGLFLVQMRARLLHSGVLKEKRTINIDMHALPEAPVKIKHLPGARARV